MTCTLRLPSKLHPECTCKCGAAHIGGHLHIAEGVTGTIHNERQSGQGEGGPSPSKGILNNSIHHIDWASAVAARGVAVAGVIASPWRGFHFGLKRRPTGVPHAIASARLGAVDGGQLVAEGLQDPEALPCEAAL